MMSALNNALLLLATTLTVARGDANETVLYLGDPQIGFSGNATLDTIRFGKAAAAAAKGASAVIIVGDLVNTWNSDSQIAQFKSVWPSHFPSAGATVHLIPGNHDINPESKTAADALARLQHYRTTFASHDYGAFRTEFASFVTINSEFLLLPYLGLNGTHAHPNVSAEVDAQWKWIERALTDAKASGAPHTVLVMHHPPFLHTEDEAEQYFNWPVEPRKRILSLARKYAVKKILCGHTHTTRTVATTDGIQLYTTAGTAKALDHNGCGWQTVTITATSLALKYVMLPGGGGAGCPYKVSPPPPPPPPPPPLSEVPRRPLPLPPLKRDLAKKCERTKLCNGPYLCADVCKPGTVEVDPHAAKALQLQRTLQMDERLARHTLIGTHNSAISLAYGFGIEQDGFETLLNRTLYENDDLGEGVDQTFSLTDQLNFGLRHLEIDITAGYFKLPHPKLDEFYVCHSPVPLDPSIIFEVTNAARKQHIDLGDWKPDKLSCSGGTTLPLMTMLEEVKAWLDAHPEEFVVLYLDTKPLTMTGKSQADALSALVRSVFNDTVWDHKDGEKDLLLNQTLRSLLQKGKRLYIEDHEDAYNQASDKIVFTPAIWSHQFGANDLSDFPQCEISGDANWYTTLTGPPHGFARGLYSDGSVLHGNMAKHDSLRAKATRCGVGVVSPNYIQPRDMAAFVWTWDVGEPSASSSSSASSCVVQKPNERWALMGCDEAKQQGAKLACRQLDDDRKWTLSDSGTSCAAGYIARPPTNGFANALLRQAAAAEGDSATLILLNVSASGELY